MCETASLVADGTPCSIGLCVGGACIAVDGGLPPDGPPFGDGGACVVNCDDSNPCTIDMCYVSTCTHTNVAAGTACTDDNNSCTTDVCDANGNCTHPALPDNTACAVAADSGLCLGGQCCVGCISAGQCRPGTSVSACGKGGAADQRWGN